KDCPKLRNQHSGNQTRNKTGGNKVIAKAYAIGGGGTNLDSNVVTAKHSSGNEEVNIASVSTASTNVSTASANIRVASMSQDTACAYITSQSSGSQIKFEDINQIDEDDMEEMDIK
nr:hypothetical protein [Tanacetum cinerariifolium]